MAKIEKLTPEDLAHRPTVFEQAENYRTMYANNVGMKISAWDFHFTFGLIKEATRERLAIENAAEVYMSPQHAKAFLKVLKQNVEQWEEAFGYIPDQSE